MNDTEKPTLLDLAKQAATRGDPRVPYHFNSETSDLAIAWARGELTYKQVHKALGRLGSSTAYSFLALALRHAIKTGRLVEGTPE